MNLQDKILYCRKKAGLSQEALAQILGVSRQAVSKWETGDAVPEISKLISLAKTFGVTTDWLLSETDPNEDNINASPKDETKTSWIDSLPGMIGRLIKRFGWVFGVYLAVIGAVFTGMGLLARYMVYRMLNGNIFGAPDSIFNEFGGQMNTSFSNMAANNPVSILGTIIMITGIILLITGTILAVAMIKVSKKSM